MRTEWSLIEINDNCGTADRMGRMSRMSRMRKILLSAPGSSRQRPNEPRGTAARDATIRESCPLFQAPWAGTRAAEAIIFCILPILPIRSKQFP
jgi:hypothetical protein